jgi:hypothetical protein
MNEHFSLQGVCSGFFFKLNVSRFRWVACQIDILGSLRTISDFRKALGELPETLYATYERVLLGIPRRYPRTAGKSLQLLSDDLNSCIIWLL